jgi:hypothetical protein
LLVDSFEPSPVNADEAAARVDEGKPGGRAPAAPRDEVRAAASSRDRPSGYVLFIATAAGYQLLDQDATPGAAGDVIHIPRVSETGFRIAKIGASPLPGDERRCAYLEPVA